MTRLLDGRHHLERFAMEQAGEVDYLITWRRHTAYVTRAIAARGGLFGNHGYEATYAIIWIDADANPLDGSNRHELRFATPPPVDAFWSFTMYDVPDFYLVSNATGRYSIGDRTPGLKTADDGRLTIYIQRDSPGPGQVGPGDRVGLQELNVPPFAVRLFGILRLVR